MQPVRDLVLPCNTFRMLVFYKNSPTQSWVLTAMVRKPFENIVWKGEDGGNQHFLLFPKCFLLSYIQIPSFESNLICNLASLKFCHLLKSLRSYQVCVVFCQVWRRHLLKTLLEKKEMQVTRQASVLEWFNGFDCQILTQNCKSTSFL